MKMVVGDVGGREVGGRRWRRRWAGTCQPGGGGG
jgi:hypothetical protein